MWYAWLYCLLALSNFIWQGHAALKEFGGWIWEWLLIPVMWGNEQRPLSMSKKERQKMQEKERRGRIWGTFAGVAVAIVPNLLPRIGAVIVIGLFVVWIASWPMARNGYKYRLASKWVVAFILLHGAILTAMGYWIWPRITLSPAHASFRGFKDETLNFSVRNGWGDDVYDVQIPFFIGRNKLFQDKLSAKVMPNGEPSPPLRYDYNYCFGTRGDGNVKNVQKDEQEVLIVHIPHMIPYGSTTFTITYSGGEPLNTKPGTPSFDDEPYTYSPTQGTVNVRGDYRICKYALQAIKTN